MRLILISLIVLSLSVTTTAQLIGDFPIISTGSRNDKPIELKKLKVSVFVVENIATTTMEMEFYNQNSRVMEGSLNFPLTNGVTVSRFALDVNGEMREGVVVDKEKATQSYESVTRQRVDPGLVEQTKGNNFRARVYPIPANGYKKALIAFEQELSGTDKEFIYKLPLNIKNELEKFSIKVEVVSNKPKVLKSKEDVINIQFEKAENIYVTEYHKTNILLNTHIAFSIPKIKSINEVLTYKGKVTSDNYFYINLNIPSAKKEKEKPKDILLVWDESASGNKRNTEKEISIIKEYIKWMNKGHVYLQTYSNTLNTGKSYKISKGECDELIERLTNSNFDGATNFKVLDFENIKADEILFFTDGITSFGELKSFKSKAPIVSINTSNIANHSLLEYLSDLSGGTYINAFKTECNQIIEKLTFEHKRFINAKYNEERIKDFYKGSNNENVNNYSFAGITEGEKSEIVLNFGFGKKITDSRKIIIDNTKRLDSNIGERIWAQKKLSHLLAMGSKDEIKAHGKKFSLVTPGTSLIVLDDIVDYIRHNITPPPSLKNDYKRIAIDLQKERERKKQSRVDIICKLFKDDIKWWEKDIDYIKQSKLSATQVTTPPPVARQEMQTLMVIDDNEEMDFNEEVTVSYSSAKEGSTEEKKKETSIVKMVQWDSNAPYMNALKSTDSNGLYAKYLTLKKQYTSNPSFYFDVATYMFQKNLLKEGLRVLSNLAELELENPEIMRMLGKKLSEYKFFDEAIFVFKEVMSYRSFEPHSYIDLGMVYADKGEYQKAIEHLYKVIEKEWDDDILTRFRGIELITLHDINNIIAKHAQEVDISFINPCFIKNMPVDVRVVIDWNANDTDIDLWIIDPNEERCGYSNKATKIGGKISNDITRGYGPEEFRLKKAISGNYKVEVNLYGNSKQTALGNITVRAVVYTKFGSEGEQKQVLTLQLEPNDKGFFKVGEVEFDGE